MEISSCCFADACRRTRGSSSELSLAFGLGRRQTVVFFLEHSHPFLQHDRSFGPRVNFHLVQQCHVSLLLPKDASNGKGSEGQHIRLIPRPVLTCKQVRYQFPGELSLQLLAVPTSSLLPVTQCRLVTSRQHHRSSQSCRYNRTTFLLHNRPWVSGSCGLRYWYKANQPGNSLPRFLFPAFNVFCADASCTCPSRRQNSKQQTPKTRWFGVQDFHPS